MIIAISGASGFIGKYIVRRFSAFAEEVLALDRREDQSTWVAKISKANVVINFSGSPVFQRWTQKNRQSILESRVNTTRKIVGIMNDLPGSVGQKLFISASAVGIYPDNKTIQYDESASDIGDGFLAEVVSKWEAEASNLTNQSVRLVIARLGVVIGKGGGFLKPILPIFKSGFGGILGTGKQLVCFIHIEDVYRAFLFFLKNPNTAGIYNLVTPNPITNKEFTHALSHRLHRSAFFVVPAFALKAIYGEASSIMLNGANVYPAKLLSQGFVFAYPTIEMALGEVVG